MKKVALYFYQGLYADLAVILNLTPEEFEELGDEFCVNEYIMQEVLEKILIPNNYEWFYTDEQLKEMDELGLLEYPLDEDGGCEGAFCFSVRSVVDGAPHWVTYYLLDENMQFKFLTDQDLEWTYRHLTVEELDLDLHQDAA